jgi:hypothetical protein
MFLSVCMCRMDMIEGQKLSLAGFPILATMWMWARFSAHLLVEHIYMMYFEGNWYNCMYTT